MLSFEFSAPRVCCGKLAMDQGRYVVSNEYDCKDQKMKCLTLRADEKPIVIHEDVHQLFCDLIDSWRRPDGHFWYMNIGFVLGRNSEGEIEMASRLQEEKGCASFPSIHGSSDLTKAMYAIMKRGLQPCGFARVSSFPYRGFSSGFYWNQDTPFSRIKEHLYVNYQPAPYGPEFYTGDSDKLIYNFRIKPSKSKVPSRDGCIDTPNQKGV